MVAVPVQGGPPHCPHFRVALEWEAGPGRMEEHFGDGPSKNEAVREGERGV